MTDSLVSIKLNPGFNLPRACDLIIEVLLSKFVVNKFQASKWHMKIQFYQYITLFGVFFSILSQMNVPAVFLVEHVFYAARHLDDLTSIIT